MAVGLTAGEPGVPERAETETRSDPLTGLGNRARLRSRISRLVAERADDSAPFSVGRVNLDGFRPINDLFGHASAV